MDSKYAIGREAVVSQPPTVSKMYGGTIENKSGTKVGTIETKLLEPISTTKLKMRAGAEVKDLSQR